jgi:hypothetical protein
MKLFAPCGNQGWKQRVILSDSHGLRHRHPRTNPSYHGPEEKAGPESAQHVERVKRGADAALVPFTVLEEVMLLSEAGKVRLPLPFRDLVILLPKQIILIWASMTCSCFSRPRPLRLSRIPMIVSLLRRRESSAYPSLPATGRFSNPAWFVLCGINQPR